MQKSIAAFGLACAFAAGAQAANWDEGSQQGDLSNDRLAPTPLLLGLGANLVRGQFGVPDRDYLVATIAPGHQLSALRTGAGIVIGGVRAFIGVQGGSSMTVPPDANSASGLLGWTHFQHGLPGADLLAEIGTGFGATGFSGPLPAGVYTFWIQDTTAAANLGYAFNFEVSAVPEPSSNAMMLGGLALLGAMARRSLRK